MFSYLADSDTTEDPFGEEEVNEAGEVILVIKCSIMLPEPDHISSHISDCGILSNDFEMFTYCS